MRAKEVTAIDAENPCQESLYPNKPQKGAC